MSRCVVIGIGNTHRRDDGFGPAVAALLRDDPRLREAGVRVSVSDGEPARLMVEWDGCATVVLVDAVRTSAPAGHWRELDVDELAGWAPASSHGFGLVETLALARALDRLPRTVIVLAATGEDFGHGTGLSPRLAAAVAPVADRVARLATTPRMRPARRQELTDTKREGG